MPTALPPYERPQQDWKMGGGESKGSRWTAGKSAVWVDGSRAQIRVRFHLPGGERRGLRMQVGGREEGEDFRLPVLHKEHGNIPSDGDTALTDINHRRRAR